jgi:hypothetical protein
MKFITMPWWYVNQTQAGIWTSDPYPQGIKLRGPVTLSGRWQTNRTDQATMVAYLYDRDPWGTMRLLTTAPWTDRKMIAGVSKSFRFSLNDQAYDVPPGHSLAVVVDAKDWLYMDETPAGANLKFSATRAQPWTLEIPYR